MIFYLINDYSFQYSFRVYLGLELTFSNLPEKYKERILERRRTHGFVSFNISSYLIQDFLKNLQHSFYNVHNFYRTRRTTFRDFKIVLPPRPAEQPRTPEQILQHPENVFDKNFSTHKSVSSKRKSVHDDDEEYEQLG